MTTKPYDDKKAGDFVGKVMTDTAALTTTVLASIGDRLGLFKDLAAHGPATSIALASRTGTNERHVREWCAAMATAGYLEHRPATGEFVLPAEHVAVLAQESGPVFFGGIHATLMGFLEPIERLIESFRTGAGVPQSAYPERAYDGMERFTAGWFENLLLPVWLPAAGVADRLRSGIEVADVGSGRGRALIKMARAFPESRFVGYDVFGPNVVRARRQAEAAGVGDRVRFEERDVTAGLDRSFDLITTFDVVHDAVDPEGLLRAIRRGLRPKAKYLCLEINCSPKLEENAGPLGALFYGCSMLYCMPTSLAHGGAALGTCGVHEPKLRELAGETGFAGVEKLPLENPFNSLYVLGA